MYTIQDAERHLDTIIFGPEPVTTCAEEYDDTTPYAAASPASASPPPSKIQNEAPGTAPDSAADDRSLRLGAKPKAPVSSTSSHGGPWTVVGGSKKKARPKPLQQRRQWASQPGRPQFSPRPAAQGAMSAMTHQRRPGATPSSNRAGSCLLTTNLDYGRLHVQLPPTSRLYSATSGGRPTPY